MSLWMKIVRLNLNYQNEISYHFIKITLIQLNLTFQDISSFISMFQQPNEDFT